MIDVKYPRRGFVIKEVIEACKTEGCTAKKLIVLPWEDYGEDDFNELTEGMTVGQNTCDDDNEGECPKCEKPVYFKRHFIVTSDANTIQTAEGAFYYAKDVLKAPFSEGETLIATDAGYAARYARDILKTPFPLGEAAIATSVQWSFNYAENVLHAPFPLGEKAIATDPYHSYHYAKDILHAPFPLGEKLIFGSEDFCKKYKELFTKPQVVAKPVPAPAPAPAPATSMSDKQKEAIKYSFDNLLSSLGEWIEFDEGDSSYPTCFCPESIMDNIDHLLEAFPDICKDLAAGKTYLEAKSYMDEYSKERKEKRGW